MGSLVPRPSPPSGFDLLQFAKTASTQKLEVVKDGKEARPEYECDIVHRHGSAWQCGSRS